ncbi:MULTISPECIES: hypothetical protein [unclassified Microcoleus]|uniref:hypothetical protein n=1 Tax=unclassified Microcoleus TaxID=2642155 RepID=UPI002FD14D1C
MSKLSQQKAAVECRVLKQLSGCETMESSSVTRIRPLTKERIGRSSEPRSSWLVDSSTIAEEYIKDLESAVISGKFLQETYRFDPALVDKAPYFSPEEEEFARSTVFAELA